MDEHERAKKEVDEARTRAERTVTRMGIENQILDLKSIVIRGRTLTEAQAAKLEDLERQLKELDAGA